MGIWNPKPITPIKSAMTKEALIPKAPANFPETNAPAAAPRAGKAEKFKQYIPLMHPLITF
jgi:hypothetical protein